jgi:hypothetical protein
MADVTYLPSSVDAGGPGVAEQFLTLVYDDLRRPAARRRARVAPRGATGG